MHPLVAIGVVLLAGLAWTVTILTLLIVLAKNRRRPPADVRSAVACPLADQDLRGEDEQDHGPTPGLSRLSVGPRL
jgi:hypothetical protein